MLLSKALAQVEWHGDSLQQRFHDLLQRVDRAGVWTVGTTVGALLIAALESIFTDSDGAARGPDTYQAVACTCNHSQVIPLRCSQVKL